jgi:hypothetical protein
VELDELRKMQADKLVEKTLKEIPRPEKITKLQDDMGLADDKKLYSHCRERFCVGFGLNSLKQRRTSVPNLKKSGL